MEQKIKSQKLSPMRYIRNNKRRVSVLVVSLSLCIAIIYVVNFLVMTTDAMARNVFLDTRKLSCVIGFTLNFEDDEYADKDNDELKNAKGFQKWMLETISINNTIEEYHSLRSRILLEQVPSGQKYLHDILQAMQDNHKIMFYYRPYWWEKEEPINVFNFEPLVLKMFKKRWYVLGKYEGGEMKIYSLDRFEDIDISEDTFSMPEDFDAEAFFKDFLGIIIDQQVKTGNILLKVSAFQANYFRSLPLHDSQQETERNEHYSLFSYRLKPTFDFMQELLSHGSTVEVLQPLSLRKDIADEIRKMVKHYKTRKK